jgi:thioredoxin-like negative regulator of GroEL
MNERMRTLITFLAADPSDLFSRYALAMEYRKEGQIVECASELQKVLKSDGNYIGAYYQLGSVLAQMGRTAEALVTFKEGIFRAKQLGDMHSAKELQEALAMMELELE